MRRRHVEELAAWVRDAADVDDPADRRAIGHVRALLELAELFTTDSDPAADDEVEDDRREEAEQPEKVRDDLVTIAELMGGNVKRIWSRVRR